MSNNSPPKPSCVVAVEKRNWMKAVIDSFLLLLTLGFGNANLHFWMAPFQIILLGIDFRDREQEKFVKCDNK